MDELIPLFLAGALSPSAIDASRQTVAVVRIATSCVEDTAEAIAAAVSDLVHQFHARNDCGPLGVKVVLFTATHDLRAAKPAAAARAAGWTAAQFLCLAEMPTADDFPRCIRGMVFVARGVGADPLKPVYLNGTSALRPDLDQQ